MGLTLVIFGASGDLTERKLIPALFALSRKDRLPKDTAIVGVARSPMSEDAFRYYRRHIAQNTDTLEYFEQATPVNELEHAQIGSRPARRSQSRQLEDLRAIPWVFGWMQSRHALPAWYGVRYALERFAAHGSK